MILSSSRLLLFSWLMGNESIDTNEVRRLFGANLSFLEYRWQCHEDFVKYAFCHCNMRDICRQAELYNICHLFLHIIFIHYYLFYDLSLSESRGICLLFDIQIHAVFHYIEISWSSENILQNNFSYLRHDTFCIPTHHRSIVSHDSCWTNLSSVPSNCLYSLSLSWSGPDFFLQQTTIYSCPLISDFQIITSVYI